MRFAMVAAVVFALTGVAGAAEYMEKTDFQKSRAFSPGVITQGGRIVWMAGQTATRDEAGNDISSNFEAQVRTVFSLMDKTLHKAGGSLDQSRHHDGVHQRSTQRRPFRRDAARYLQRRQLPRQRADHGVELGPPRHADRNPRNRGDWRRMLGREAVLGEVTT